MYCDNQFMMYVKQIITLYTLNLSYLSFPILSYFCFYTSGVISLWCYIPQSILFLYLGFLSLLGL